MKSMFALTLMMVGFASTVVAAEPMLAWPQFRGPQGSGVADQQKPPVEIGPDKNVLWKVAVPSGFSSPIVVGDLVVFTTFEDEKLYTVAYSKADGKQVWRTEAVVKQIEPYHKTEGSPAASTPVTDGKHIVSYFGSGGLFCYDLTGKEIWKYDLPMATTPGDFGTGASPVLADGAVILVRDELKSPMVISLDLASGKLNWEKKRQSVSCYSTPAIWSTSAGKQIVAPGVGRMIGYDLKSGEEKWFVTGMPAACCTTPVINEETLYFAGWSPGDPDDKDFKFPSYEEVLKAGDTDSDGKLSREESQKTFLKDFFDANDTNKDGFYTRDESDALLAFMSSSRNSTFALKSGGSGDITDSHVKWKNNKNGLPYVPSAIFYRDQYVMVKDGGIVTVYNAESGKMLNQGRTVATGRYYASPVAANGLIYFTTLDDGVITVIKAGSPKVEVVAKNPSLGERVAATPAIADDRLYVRTAGHLYAFGVK